MPKTHWKKLNNPDYLGAYALEPGQEIVATIKVVGKEIVTGPDGKKEECTVIHFQESNIKPMILNVTNAKIIQKIYKTPYIEDWSGRKIQIYADMVKAFGEVVEALRIRPFIPKQAELVKNEPHFCADCGQEIQPFDKYDAAYMAARAYKKYGKELCADCAKAEAEKVEKSEIKDPLADGEPALNNDGGESNENNENQN